MIKVKYVLTKQEIEYMIVPRGKEKSNEINKADMVKKRTCYTYQQLIHEDSRKGDKKYADYNDKRAGQRSVRGTALHGC
ncbi:hypothetical protein K030075H31_37480 [Blautia producta]